jgi:histidine triad (HIT) family protein
MINKEENCIFCKIVSGEIPRSKIYEDDYTMAFLSIGPNNPGHTLVIPKDHFENLYGLPDETLCRIIITVKKIAIAIKNGLEADGVNIGMNNEVAAGQEILHAHFHVIPRKESDGLMHWPAKAYLPGEAEEVEMKIKFALE